MPARRLDTEEAALWARVMATVRPIHPVKPQDTEVRPAPKMAARRPVQSPPPPPGRLTPPKGPGDTLDGSWDRRLTRGIVQPDSAIDLHGHTLHSAHRLLDQELERAIARGDRVLLLVTGKPPRAESERPHARGAIRAAIGDWLAVSRHAAAIASVRGAHPRHGGTGALYIILRRPKPSRKS